MEAALALRFTRAVCRAMVNPLIRRAAAEDAAAIASIHIRGWQAAYRGQLSDLYLDQLGNELEGRTGIWQKMISTPPSVAHEIWLAVNDSRVDGFVAIGPARGPDEAGCGEVYAIYVSPDRWSQGLGRALFAHANERLASGFARAVLWVLESNARARRFYKIAGWAEDGGTKLERLPDDSERCEVRYGIRFHREVALNK